MPAEFIAEAGKVVVGAIAGGLITAASALPYLNNKINSLTKEVSLMKESCTACKSSLEGDVANLTKEVNTHHTDDEKHVTKALDILLNDIRTRVMRIENRLFNGHSHDQPAG